MCIRDRFCSAPFTITPAMAGEAEPPIIINPANNSQLNPEQKQSLQFNWTMPGGAAAGTQYKLRIIEVSDPGMNYRDMLHNDRYPAFFETTVSAAPMYLYTAANPPFKEDKTYAFVVRAFNAIGTATVNYKNDGYSAVSYTHLVQARGKDGYIEIYWPKGTGRNNFTYYNVERSEDGKTFHKIHEKPLVFNMDVINEFVYADSVQNYKTDVYKRQLYDRG